MIIFSICCNDFCFMIPKSVRIIHGCYSKLSLIWCFKNNQSSRRDQLVECLPNKHEVLNSNPSTDKQTNKQTKQSSLIVSHFGRLRLKNEGILGLCFCWRLYGQIHHLPLLGSGSSKPLKFMATLFQSLTPS
jgi:hypothetical protein